MSDSEQLRRDMEAFIQQHHATDVGAVGDAVVVEDTGGGSDDDALLEAMTRAVQQPEGWQPGQEGGAEASPTTPPPSTGAPLTTTPPTGSSLNAGVDGDEQLTAWLNNRLNS